MSSGDANCLTDVNNLDEYINPRASGELRCEARRMVKAILEEAEERRKNPRPLSLADFEVGCPLGRGAFGRVFLARERKSKFMVAIKMFFKSQASQLGWSRQLSRELEIQSRLTHQNVLRLFAKFEDKRRIYFVLEYAAKGDLFTVQRRQPEARFKEPAAAKFVYHVACGLLHCHKAGVMHRDIKPENLLLDIDYNIKMADFGWSVRSPDQRRRTLCGTLDYLPPEMVSRQEYSSEVDQWSLGVLCFELLTGGPPFESKTENEVFRNIMALKVKYPRKMPAGSRDLVQGLLRLDASSRMSLEQVMEHTWILDYKDCPFELVEED